MFGYLRTRFAAHVEKYAMHHCSVLSLSKCLLLCIMFTSVIQFSVGRVSGLTPRREKSDDGESSEDEELDVSDRKVVNMATPTEAHAPTDRHRSPLGPLYNKEKVADYFSLVFPF